MWIMTSHWRRFTIWTNWGANRGGTGGGKAAKKSQIEKKKIIVKMFKKDMMEL